MALTGGLETGGGDGIAAAAAAGASLLEREPAAIVHGGGALNKHSLLKAEGALAALPCRAAAARRARHAAAAARPDPARDAAGIRPARRAARLFLCCVLYAVCTRPHNRSGFIRSQAKSREMGFPFTQGQSRRPNLIGDSVTPDPNRPRVVAPGSTRTAGRPWVDLRSVVRGANKR